MPRRHALARGDGEAVDLVTVTLKPPVSRPDKIICVGLNFAQHAAETGFKPPEVPEIFARLSTSLVGGEEPLRRPRESVQLDFEGELAAVIGRSAASAMSPRSRRATSSPAARPLAQSRGPGLTRVPFPVT
jgi:2-keto-4-pentenoate hydratase/2-oxohepta-3-ene-1,7-dioic acid hydratase in catechol pathway